MDVLDAVVRNAEIDGENEDDYEKEQHHRWDVCPPLIHCRYQFASAWLRGEVFSIGSDYGPGFGTVERLDTLSKRRTVLQQPSPLPYLRYLSAAVLNDKLYIIGGLYNAKREANEDDDEDEIDDEGMVIDYVESDAVYCLVDHPTDPSAATWALQSATLNTPRRGHASIAFEGKIWVAGGFDSEDIISSSVEVYDPAVGEWERAPDMTKSDPFLPSWWWETSCMQLVGMVMMKTYRLRS